MQRGDLMARNKKMRSFAAILIGMLLLSMIPLFSFADEGEGTGTSTGNDISDEDWVTIDRVEIYKDETLFMVDGVLEEGQTSFHTEDSLRFKVKWSITQENCAKIAEGDYFEIDFPAYLNMFAVAEKPIEASIVNESTGEEEIGTFYANKQDGTFKMRLTFADISDFNGIEDGYMQVTGKVTAGGSDDDVIIIGDVTIPVIKIPTPGNPNWGSGTASTNPLTKVIPYQNNRTYQWAIAANMDQQYKQMFGGVAEPRENVLIVDELPDGLEYSKLYISHYERFVTDYEKKQVSWRIFNDPSRSIIDQFENLNSVYTDMDSLTPEEFKQRVKDHPNPCYAVYKKKILAINAGDLPGDLETSSTWKEFKDRLNAMAFAPNTTDLEVTDTVKDAMLKAYANIYDPAGGTPADDAKGDVIGLNITLDTIATKSFSGLKNSVIMTYDGGDNTATSGAVYFSEGGAGATVLDKGSIEITKKDSVTDEVITGVGFTLMKQNTDGEFVSISGLDEKLTDDQGKVLFEDLTDGTYKIVESTRKEGYLDGLVIKDENGETLADNTFEINADQTKGFAFTAYNDPVPKESITTPGGTVQGETSTPEDNGSVLGEEANTNTNAAEDGSVLGEEATTADSMNILILLLTAGLAVLIILTLVLRLRLMKE